MLKLSSASTASVPAQNLYSMYVTVGAALTTSSSVSSGKSLTQSLSCTPHFTPAASSNVSSPSDIVEASIGKNPPVLLVSSADV